MTARRTMLVAGTATFLQAIGQMALMGTGLAQYFCIIDFFRNVPILLYLKILYFHNSDTCGVRINVGQSLDGVADQALVLVTQTPLPAYRTFILNCTSLGLALLWLIASITLMMGGARNNQGKAVRWPWLVVTVAVCAFDLVATVIYANDSFYTRTLSEVVEYIGAVASGFGNVEVNTSWAAWTMVLLYSRLVIIFALNLCLLVSVIIDYKQVEDNVQDRMAQLEAAQAEQAAQVAQVAQTAQAVQTAQAAQQAREGSSAGDVEEGSDPSSASEPPPARIPRPGLSHSFRRMKTLLFQRTPSVTRRTSDTESLDSPVRTPPRSQAAVEAGDRKRTVNFPENLLSLPQRLENLIAEQQRRLDRAVVDTAVRPSPPRTSQSLPHLSDTQPDDARGRRGTAAELAGQLPWAYIPAAASARRMRDQLPPDEDLPPVPLPDYTAIQPFRKASVHRAASSLSSLNRIRQPLNQSDVLY